MNKADYCIINMRTYIWMYKLTDNVTYLDGAKLALRLYKEYNKATLTNVILLRTGGLNE